MKHCAAAGDSNDKSRVVQKSQAGDHQQRQQRVNSPLFDDFNFGFLFCSLFSCLEDFFHLNVYVARTLHEHMVAAN